MKKNMQPQTNPHYAAIAQEILAKKEFVNYYTVEYHENDCGSEDWREIPLTEQEVAELRSLLAEEDYPLFELEDQISFYQKIEEAIDSNGFYYFPCSIDLDHPIHYMEVTVVAMPSADAEPMKCSLHVSIKDEERLQLLTWRLANRRAPFQRFACEHPDLFCKISRSVENQACYTLPYIVYLDEIDAEIFNAVGEPDYEVCIYAHYTNEISEVMNVYFSERKMSINYQYLCGDSITGWDFVDMDAIALERIYGVSTYSELASKLKEDFGYGFKSLKAFTDFLTENHITYRAKVG